MLLTDLEQEMLASFVAEGADCVCADSAEAIIEDNMTWMDPNDLQTAMGLTKQALGGVMASLSEKGLIEDSGEPLPERSVNAWTATAEGIRIGWNLLD